MIYSGQFSPLKNCPVSKGRPRLFFQGPDVMIEVTSIRLSSHGS